MNLVVHVIEARSLRSMGSNEMSNCYTKIQLGKHRAKTKVMKKTLNPSWDEKFHFRVGNLTDKLTVSVFNEDKYFNDEFLGWIKMSLSDVFDADNCSLGTAWYQLQPKSNKSKCRYYGEIHLTISFYQKNSLSDEMTIFSQNYSDGLASNSDKSTRLKGEMPCSSSDKSTELKGEMTLPSSSGNMESFSGVIENKPAKEDKSKASSLADIFFQVFHGKKLEAALLDSRLDSLEELQDTSLKPEPSENQADNDSSNVEFGELLKILVSKDQDDEMPENLAGGVLVDQSFIVAPGDMNSLLFSPSSKFLQSMTELHGTKDLQPHPWRLENGVLKRLITYTKAASKLIKAVKATEDQTYLKADGKSYAVLASVSIPDVPCGSYFKTEILYCIMPGLELPSGGQSSHLRISWRLNFLQSTMMKSMIENGARQGLKESFAQFADLLSQNVKLVDSKGIESNKEYVLPSLQMKQESNWKLAFQFFGNFTVLLSVIMGLYVISHIIVANIKTIKGLEFVGLDLPDSIEEVVVCGVLILQGKHVLKMIRHYLQARKLRGSDHGVNAQGDGWLLTVALIEGSNLAAVDSSGFSDPYVVFTCNGKTKISSIKFQTRDPQWNEVFEFDAMGDPPSRMDVVAYDGSFDDATSLGCAEVNFVKSSLSELADAWIPLQGKFPQACQSKLHLRILLKNTQGTEVITEYLTKVEREVGKKINLRSPQTNSAFQKIFGLPPEEFLINDFTCHLKRKMPLQGRLFLSPRIIGFYANLFGRKTKFFFLWEDIDEIQVIPPSLASIGSPSLMIILCKGRGMDAKHGAKALDWDGRLKFHFQSFVLFQAANRIIMALWKARSLSPEQKVQIVEEESETKSLYTEESGCFMSIDDDKMSEVFFSALPVSINSLMEIFDGGPLECRLMEKVGCVDYSVSPWEPIKPDIYQRQVSYKSEKNISHYRGKVASTQHKSPLPDGNGWVIEEVMTLQGLQVSDYFRLRLKYQVKNEPSKPETCNVQVYMGIAWLKSAKHRKRITKNVTSNSCLRLRELFSLVEEGFLQAK